MDVPQPLERPAIKDPALTRLDADEIVNGIADFVEVFGHHELPAAVSNAGTLIW